MACKGIFTIQWYECEDADDFVQVTLGDNNQCCVITLNEQSERELVFYVERKTGAVSPYYEATANVATDKHIPFKYRSDIRRALEKLLEGIDYKRDPKYMSINLSLMCHYS